MPSISLAPPNLPTASNLLAQIKSSCSAATRASGIEVNRETLRNLISNLPPATSKDYSLALPLRWQSTSDEVNFLSLLAVCSILSPFNLVLRQLPGRPSPLSLPRHLLLGLYLSAPPSNHSLAASPLSSAHLASLTDGEISEILGLKIHEEKKVEHIPVATLAERGGPGSRVVIALRETLNRIGEACVTSRYVDLGAFVVETLAQSKGIANVKGEEEAVGHFVHRLVSFLPLDMTDCYTISEEVQVHMYSNALFLLLSLVLRFPPGGSTSPLPWLPSRRFFPLVADGQIPLLLARRGVLNFDACTDVKLQAWGRWATTTATSTNGSEGQEVQREREPVLSSDQAEMLRSAAVYAGEVMGEEQVRAAMAAAGEQRGAIDLDALVRRQTGPGGEAWLTIEEREMDRAGKW